MAIYMGAGPSVMYAAQADEAFDQFKTSRRGRLPEASGGMIVKIGEGRLEEERKSIPDGVSRTGARKLFTEIYQEIKHETTAHDRPVFALVTLAGVADVQTKSTSRPSRSGAPCRADATASNADAQSDGHDGHDDTSSISA